MDFRLGGSQIRCDELLSSHSTAHPTVTVLLRSEQKLTISLLRACPYLIIP